MSVRVVTCSNKTPLLISVEFNLYLIDSSQYNKFNKTDSIFYITFSYEDPLSKTEKINGKMIY